MDNESYFRVSGSVLRHLHDKKICVVGKVQRYDGHKLVIKSTDGELINFLTPIQCPVGQLVVNRSNCKPMSNKVNGNIIEKYGNREHVEIDK